MCFWKLSCKKILSLFLLSTLISSGIIEPANAQAKVFGVMGRDGDRGRSGRNGSSGTDISIQATNQSKTFDISGSDGSNGEVGYSGESASQCQQPQKVKYHLRGANGGNGGKGGNGGNGGNGGEATIYFQTTQQLKNILLKNNGGRGGMGAEGGRGGGSCRYTRRNWVIHYCNWALMAKPKQIPNSEWSEVKRRKFRCTGDSFFDEQNNRPKPQAENSQYRYGWKYIGVTNKIQYTARHGRNGSSGSHGKNGSSGKYGKVWLVKGEAIPKQRTNYSNYLSSINGKTIKLLKNNWLKKNGLRQFLDAGSNIPDSYRLLQTVRNSFSVDWKTKKSFADLGNPSMDISIDKSGDLDFSIPGTLEYKKIIQPNKTTIAIVNGIHPNRLKQFKFRGFDRFRDARNFALLDEGDLLKEIEGLIITVELSNGKTSKNVSYGINSQTQESEKLKVWGNLYKFRLGEEFDSLLQPGQEITYTINIQQIAKSGSRYASGMRVTQVVDRMTPHPDVTYYRSSM